MKIHYLLHRNNYRIGFVTPKAWAQKPYCKKLKHWFFSFKTIWPDTKTEVSKLYIFGLGFGYKKQIR